jgi:hypothetical protein
MHSVNAGFTVIAPLAADRVEAVTALLRELDADQARLPFARSETTHFATITIIPAQRYRDEPLPAVVLFATSFCGPARAHVRELVDVMGNGLRTVFAHCDGFDAGCDDDELVAFLLDHRHGDTFYSGMQHLRPIDVRRHQQLRNAIEAFLDERAALPEKPLEARRAIQDYVSTRPDLAWTREPWKPTLGAWAVFHWRTLVIEAAVLALVAATVARCYVASTLLSVIVTCGWIAVGAFVWMLVVMIASIRDAESAQTYLSARPPDARAKQLAATQKRPVINEFTLGGPIKEEGDLRPLFLRVSLWIIARVVEGVPGLPSLRTGINIPTVATARWIVADRGRRVMFISNYTNDGVSYVRDFIETRPGAMRINLSFGFGLGFPKTRWIFKDGALTDPNTYLYSLAENQLPTLFWYGPYRDISIDNIYVARKIREGLFGNLTEKQARDWLRLL